MTTGAKKKKRPANLVPAEAMNLTLDLDPLMDGELEISFPPPPPDFPIYTQPTIDMATLPDDCVADVIANDVISVLIDSVTAVEVPTSSGTSDAVVSSICVYCHTEEAVPHDCGKIMCPSCITGHSCVFCPAVKCTGEHECNLCSKPLCKCSCKGLTMETILGAWGISREFDLTLAAANFYATYHYYLESENREPFDAVVQKIGPILRNYTAMVIGGELRHANQVMDEARTAFESNPPLKLCVSGLVGPRPVAWKRWQEYINEQGLVAALTVAIAGFNLFVWPTSVGGPRWAMLAERLIWFEEGKLTEALWIDLAFNAVHNGGSYFNKLPWSRHQLTLILDSNTHERWDTISDHCSSEVRQQLKGVELL